MIPLAGVVCLAGAPGGLVFAQARAGGATLPVVQTADVQSLLVNVGQIADTLDFLGAPLAATDQESLRRVAGLTEPNAIARAVQAALDPYCAVMIHLNPESRVKVEAGPAARRLVQHGWTPFLVKIRNESGWTGALGVSSPQAGPVFDKEYCAPWSDTNPINGPAAPPRPDEVAARVRDRWLDLEICVQRPMNPQLHGIGLEYAIVCLRSRDAGRRTAVIGFDIGQGSQDLGFRGEVALTFECAPAVEVKLGVKDELGRPATGAFVIRDRSYRVYPSPYKRLAPDFFFQPQVYREDGESVALAAGDYVFEFSRGPESVVETRQVTIGTKPVRLDFQVRRWVDPAAFGYVAGDHHIHGAGCAHYTTPSLGVTPADLIRQVRGEGLRMAGVLTWGPGYESQHKFFTGRDDPVSDGAHRLRYDVEVSGFGSYRTGHLCLLRLKDQHYPGSRDLDGWPTLGLSILKWAKRQGAFTGSPHSGGGYQLGGDRTNNTAIYAKSIPFLDTPSFDGTGAVEYLVNITHEVPGPDGRPVPAVDIISTGNTPYVAELTVWYHTLNCGFRPRAAGESDFPCLNGDRVGHSRSYVRVPGELGYDTWCEALAQGRGYVSEGRSHLIDFRAGDTRAGEKGGEMRLAAPGTVKARVKAAALLDASPAETLAWPVGRSQTELNLPPVALQPVARPAFENRTRPWFWHIERARVAGTRRVPVELIVNGEAVARREIDADGVLRDLEFEFPIMRSSWVAMRILGSSHTNPVFVLVEDRPIRASRRSAAWCLAGVDGIWNRKSRFYADAELAEARATYDHAREVYRRILAESPVE